MERTEIPVLADRLNDRNCPNPGFRTTPKLGMILGLLLIWAPQSQASKNRFLTEVPDYDWWRGCFGTATGNLMGYWDRHGMDRFYTGPTTGGVAPLDSGASHGGIRSMWASRAGFDGRPANKPGHDDDYWIGYEDTDSDPWEGSGRPEHEPDCIGDFIGLNQLKWSNLNGECAGNVDGYVFTFWDATAERRWNFTPPALDGQPVRDVPSGLAAWTRYRGSECETFSQLAEINPEVPVGKGFTYDDLVREIEAGYPVLLFLQDTHAKSRPVGPIPNANPSLHGILAYGYYAEGTQKYVRLRDSWAGGDNRFCSWMPGAWLADLPLRGVIGYHPKPKITQYTRNTDSITLAWEGPASVIFDSNTGTTTPVHNYVVEQASVTDPTHFTAITPSSPNHSATVPIKGLESSLLRIRLTAGGN